MLLRIEQATPETLQLLVDRGFLIDNVKGLGAARDWIVPGGPQIDLWATDHDLRELHRLGLDPVELPDTAYEMFLRQQELPRDQRDYHGYDSLTSTLQNYADTYPSVCRLYSVGQSVEGRELWVLKISDNPDLDEDEPEFKYVSTMHGNEPVGTEMLLFLIDDLIMYYGVDPRLTDIVDTIELHFLPMMNPDGNNDGRRTNANFVDLNRDFPDQFVDPVNTPAGREPETQAVMNWTDAHHFIMSANFHTGALVVNYPYDGNEQGSNTYSPTLDDDLFIDLSLAYSVHNLPMYNGAFPQGITNGADWYAISGGMQDWNYVWMGDMETTIELSDTFWPDQSLLPDYWDDNRESMLSYMEYCLRGIRGVVTDSESGLPVAGAEVRIGSSDFVTCSASVVGDYHRLCLPGSHDLEVSKDGYETALVGGVAVADGAATVVNVSLVPIDPAPDLVLEEVEVVDGDNGRLDPGESALLNLTLRNDGNAPALNVDGLLGSTSPWITITDAGDFLGDVNPDASITGTFALDVDAGTPAGELVAFQLQLTGDGDYAQQVDFELSVGLIVEDFESASFTVFPWEMGGDADWLISGSPWEGAWCAQSGDVSHNQSSSLSLTLEVLAPGDLSFFYKASSEATYDFLYFYLDGVPQGGWSGEVGWTLASYAVSAGTHTFAWAYEKDGSVSDGSDCGWVDYIIFPAVGLPPTPSLTVDPTSIEATVEPGGTGETTLTLGNVGEGELSWSVQVSTDNPLAEIHPPLKLAKGEVDPRPGQGARDAGGPDSFGYSWMDSNEPGGPVFDWVELSGVGGDAGGGDDSSLGPFDLGFTMSYYGNTYTQVRVCTNGFLSFTSSATNYTNDPIPGSSEPNNMIAPFWDDLNPNDGGTIWYWSDVLNGRFIVQWDGVPHYSGGGPETFEAILYADSRIVYQYQTVDTGTSSTVGIENSSGTDGLQVVYNSAYLANGLAIEFSTEELWLEVSPMSGTLFEGQTEPLTVSLDATDLVEGEYTGTITVYSNDPEHTVTDVPVTLTVGDTSLEPVSDLQATCAGGTLTLSWSPVAGATGYRIYSSADAYASYSFEDTVTETSWQTPCAGNRRFFYVTATN